MEFVRLFDITRFSTPHISRRVVSYSIEFRVLGSHERVRCDYKVFAPVVDRIPRTEDIVFLHRLLGIQQEIDGRKNSAFRILRSTLSEQQELRLRENLERWRDVRLEASFSIYSEGWHQIRKETCPVITSHDIHPLNRLGVVAIEIEWGSLCYEVVRRTYEKEFVPNLAREYLAKRRRESQSPPVRQTLNRYARRAELGRLERGGEWPASPKK